MDDLVAKIIAYSKENDELMKSHHFLFNLPQPGADLEKIDFIVFGINPGESDEDWKAIDQPLQQETHLEDFHEKYRDGRNEVAWTSKIRKYCGTDNVVQTEAFFWSSKRVNEQHFDRRFGYSFNSERCKKHLRFCAELNSELISNYRPKAIIAPGLNLIDILPSIYNLVPSCIIKCPKTGHRLVEKYYSSEKLPWIFTKHWSGARGMTQEQTDIISKYIKSI